MVVCLEQGADLHMAQLMPWPLTVSRFSKIQIGFTFLVPAYPGSPGQRAVKRVCVCVFLFSIRRQFITSEIRFYLRDAVLRCRQVSVRLYLSVSVRLSQAGNPVLYRIV